MELLLDYEPSGETLHRSSTAWLQHSDERRIDHRGARSWKRRRRDESWMMLTYDEIDEICGYSRNINIRVA